MKQLIRRVIDPKGIIRIEEIPTPHAGENQALISSHYSLISSGTELAEISKNPIELAKLALTDPWMRNAVKDLIFSGGLKETADTITNELFLYRLIGYSGSGIVLAKGKNITDVQVGDKVAFAAQGHAEQVAAYANHVVKIPENLDLKYAAFATVGAVALQGIRRSQGQIGEWVVVYGLGLLGQLAAQILLASGMRVIGIDLSEQRVELAMKAGLKYVVNPAKDDAVDTVLRITAGKGADCVMICAASQDSVIANNAMKMARKQGRVTFVGIVKMDLERKPFFLNELDLSFSRAYGPGSYDPSYEKGRIEYPYQYIRWTEKRNLEEVIRLMAENRLNIEPLIDSIFPLGEAQKAFDKVKTSQMKSVAVLLSYPKNEKIETKIVSAVPRRHVSKDVINIGVIGSGNFTRNVHIPNLSRLKKFNIKAICSASGMNAAAMAKRYNIECVTTQYHDILQDPNIDTILIATRHDLHSLIAIEAAKAQKNIFVEKPVAMSLQDLDAVRQAVKENDVCFMAGYNRRFSPIVQKAKKYITQKPIVMNYVVNIKNLSDSHWTLDPVEGGGRLLGEADHFFDLMNCFAGSRPKEVSAASFPISTDTKEGLFNFAVQVKYENNSLGQLIYTSLGGPKIPRERLEIFCGSKTLEIIDFNTLLINGKIQSKMLGMGHFEELEYFSTKISGHCSDEDLDDALSASWVCLKAHEQIIHR
ncbi:MAG: bi-domain-containing oxidoreductase [Candidatus Omnitrophota bacterium]